MDDESAEHEVVAVAATRSPIQVIDRSVALLTEIAAAGAVGISLKDLTATVGLRSSTARTVLSALVAHGLVRQVERHYLLGSTFFDLNRSYVAQSDLATVGTPVLRDLWRATSETVHLSLLKDAQRVDISVLVSPQLLNINPTSARFEDGPVAPPYRTAAGKVLLAGLTREQRETLLASAPWQRAGTGGLSDDEVHAMAEQVVAQGYATNLEEEAQGVCGVAAPVANHTGTTVAALCVGYPTVRHTPNHSEALRIAVMRSAAEFSALLGAPASSVEGSDEA